MDGFVTSLEIGDYCRHFVLILASSLFMMHRPGDDLRGSSVMLPLPSLCEQPEIK